MKNNTIKEISLDDLIEIADVYIEYFNQEEMMTWDKEKVIKKFRQLVLREDYFGLGLFDDHNQMIGFAVGSLVQFDDGIIAHLNELFISKAYQSKGLGSELLKAFERYAKKMGAFRIQLESTDDDIHHRFYNQYNDYKDTSTHVIKAKKLS